MQLYSILFCTLDTFEQFRSPCHCQSPTTTLYHLMSVYADLKQIIHTEWLLTVAELYSLWSLMTDLTDVMKSLTWETNHLPL